MMKRVLEATFVVAGMLMFTAAVSAESPSGASGGRRWAGPRYDQWEAKRQLYKKLTNKTHKPAPIPIDPGRGDGKPINPPQAVPQGPPGFVWVNGHWERVKAPAPQQPAVVVRDHRKVKTGQVIVRDHRTAGGVVIRDHRATGEVIVRDHRTTGGVVVRDHRVVTAGEGQPVQPHDVSSSPGGVTVSDSPAKEPSVVIRDHRKR